MPTTKEVGATGEANSKIGGVPTIHYFDLKSRGRGQVLRAFFEEAGIAYKDVRYSHAEWPEFKKSEVPKMNPLGSLPILELNGRYLTQSYAVLRHFSRLLGKYEGKSEEEVFWTDSLCDVASDWRSDFVNAFFTPNKDTEYPKHIETKRPKYLNGLEAHLTNNKLSAEGPFTLGNAISYVDFVIYQNIHDENLSQDGYRGLKDYPRLAKLAEAVENQPNFKKYLSSDRYLG